MRILSRFTFFLVFLQNTEIHGIVTMYSLLHSTILGTLQVTGLLLVLAVGYIIYLRYFHPLAKYPGPFWASVTNFWKAYHYWTLKLPQTMVKLRKE